jgi:hypothetical protein
MSTAVAHSLRLIFRANYKQQAENRLVALKTLMQASG